MKRIIILMIIMINITIYSQFQNYIYIGTDIKYENRIKNDYKPSHGWYENQWINDSILRDYSVYNAKLISIGFKSQYDKKFYAQFIADLRLSETAYYNYKNYNIYNLKDITYISLDFPTNSYLNYKDKNYEITLGRTKIKSGNLIYPITLSNNAPYYDNLNIKIKLNKINYQMTFISSFPFLSKQEYEYKFSKGNFSAYRNDIFQKIYHEDQNFEYALQTLNHIAGRLPSPLDIIKSETGLLSTYIKYKTFINMYAEYIINYSNLKSSFAFGMNKTFDILNLQITPTIEYYNISKNIYHDEDPYKQLYYRGFSLSNTPPARLMFNYPFGFKYGEDSNMIAMNLNIENKNLKINIQYDNGKNKEGKINNLNLNTYIKLKYGDIKLSYINLNLNEKHQNIISIHYIFDLDIQL